MKAVITKAYGSADVLSVENVDKPIIGEDEILVEVRAASINPIDWKIRNGELKMMIGKTPPRILGADYAGVVSAVGAAITGYKVGDEVFGMINGMKAKEGTYAEFVSVKESDIGIKPANCTFEEAASLPMVSLTSHKALVDIAGAKKGSRVLINGCTGGVGSAAVQIANALGCTTTGVCSTANVEFAKELGTTAVIDYKKQNVLEQSETYDIIFDTVGNLEFGKAKDILNGGGVYVTTNASVPAMILNPVANIFRSKKSKMVMSGPDSDTLQIVKKMVEDGKLKGQVANVFSIDQIVEAHKMSEKGGFRGKLLLKM